MCGVLHLSRAHAHAHSRLTCPRMWGLWTLFMGGLVVALPTSRAPCDVYYGAAACDERNPAVPVFQEIARLQSPVDCRTAPLLVNDAPYRQAGLGSRFSFYRACLALAVSQSRTYVDVTCARSSDCLPDLVEPWTTCSAADVEAAQAQGRATVIRSAKPCYPFFQASPLRKWPDVVWAAAATSFLLRPTKALRAQVQYDLDHMPPFRMGLHVRHCDKGSEAVLRPLEAYVRLLSSRVPTDPLAAPVPILLVTDDQEMYRELARDSATTAAQSPRQGARTPFLFGNGSTRALRDCEWCGAGVGASGRGECYRAHEARALIDLHLLAEASVTAFTFSSNYGQMLLHLQLFKHAFCAVALPVDSYFHALGHGWAYLRQETPLVRQGGRIRFAQNVTLVKTGGAGGGDRGRTSAPLSAEAVADMAEQQEERRDPFARAVHATCNVSDAAPSRCSDLPSAAQQVRCHVRHRADRVQDGLLTVKSTMLTMPRRRRWIRYLQIFDGVLVLFGVVFGVWAWVLRRSRAR